MLRKFKNIIALSPFCLFFFIFIGSGLYFTLKGHSYAFYQISAAVAILPAIILAFLIAYTISKISFQTTLNHFLNGARDNNIVIMCLIYLLAGAYGTVLQNIGAVTSTVNLALNFLPKEAALPSLFLIASVISTAMGTSMGTIAAIGPIGVGIANSVGLPLPLTVGAIISGAMFGDNLSMISDTTIAATQIHNCSPVEKFKTNAIIAFPAMLVTLVILTLLGWSNQSTMAFSIGEFQILPCLPYVIVLVLALFGMNVFLVLTIGLLSAGMVGLFTLPSYTILQFSKNIFEGYQSMSEILILSLLMGGLGELIKQQGGFSAINSILNRFILSKNQSNPRLAESAVVAITGFSDICTANNTAAIILSGESTKEIAQQHKIKGARAATLVDLSACVFQGILPYSAQVLMAGAIAGITPLSIVPNVFYCYLLGIAGLLSILIRFPQQNTVFNTLFRRRKIEQNNVNDKSYVNSKISSL